MSNELKTELKEFDSSTLTANNQNFGSALEGVGIKVQFINPSDVDVYITDGSSNWRVFAGGTVTFDEQTQDDQQQGSRFHLSKGAQLQIRQVTGSGTGTVVAHIVTEVNL